ncbi:MAG: 5-formyltetrahydrofolate cyclo-ligase [Synechococcaceae cyanobacterium]|nr:5-formyltetrahydrofolate cyclo-ligase [Synechococcaceae cyanobacterium]
MASPSHGPGAPEAAAAPAGDHQHGAAQAKQALRSHFRRRRREALGQAADGILAVAQRELPALLPPGRRLGLWWPVGAEPDPRPLAAALEAQAPGRLALPAVLAWPGPGPRLLYLPWRPGDPLHPDACAIPSPAPPAPGGPGPLAAAHLALLLVPALAIDRSGIRLGSGGGWYDRLRADPAWRAVPALAVLPAACVCAEALPRDPWDVPFDGWLDETGLHHTSNPGRAAGDFVASS